MPVHVTNHVLGLKQLQPSLIYFMMDVQILMYSTVYSDVKFNLDLPYLLGKKNVE